MKYLSILLIVFASCQTAKQWNKKGFERGWIDTATISIYDTVHILGSSKDTLFYSSSDTIVLKDSMFVTKYFYNTITKQSYLTTTVPNKDVPFIKEIHKTTIKEVAYTFWDHLKAVWFVWLGLFVLLIIIALIALFKK
jgi:hypothetical protein